MGSLMITALLQNLQIFEISQNSPVTPDKIGEKFKDFQLHFPYLFQRCFTMLSEYGII